VIPNAIEIFQNGILGYDFETVAKVMGHEKAVYWGEFTENWQDVNINGITCPLSGFLFQTTYAKYKKAYTEKV